MANPRQLIGSAVRFTGRVMLGVLQLGAAVFIGVGADGKTLMRLSGVHTPPAAGLADLARQGNHAALLKQLLYGGNPDSCDRQGNTPLQVAARQGNAQAAHLLLQSGATVDATDSTG